MSIPLIVPGDGGATAWDQGSTATVHSASITTTRSNLVLLLVMSNTTTSPPGYRTATGVTGAGLTWHLYASRGLSTGAVNNTPPPATGGLGIEVWWASAPSPIAAQTITVTLSGQPSRGFFSVNAFSRCADITAPWDTGPGLPVITAGSFPNASTITLSQRNALFLRFYAGSFATPGSLTYTPNIMWSGFGGQGISGGAYFEFFGGGESLSPELPTPPAPVASGCDPRTPTSLTASWSAVAPVQYPLRVGETHTVNYSNAGIWISIYGALVGAPLGNIITYHVQYERTDGGGDGPIDIYGIDALTTTLTGLDDGADYTWRVWADDSAGDESVAASSDILCPQSGTAGVAPFKNLISLRWSDDRGHSWSSPVTQSMGEPGEYRTSIQYQRLGMARDRVFEISWSTPFKTALQGAWIDVTPAQS